MMQKNQRMIPVRVETKTMFDAHKEEGTTNDYLLKKMIAAYEKEQKKINE